MKAYLSRIAPTLGPLGRWLRRVFQLDRRWGVRFDKGHERTGFMTRGHAEGWAKDKGIHPHSYVTFYYDPIDLRCDMAEQPIRARESYRP